MSGYPPCADGQRGGPRFVPTPCSRVTLDLEWSRVNGGRVRTQIPVRPSASRFALALMLTLGATAVAYRPASAEIEHPRPFLVRVEGFVGDKPEGVKSLDRWVVAIDG